MASIAPMTAPARSVVFCMRAHRPTRRRCRRSRHPTAMPHAWSGVTRRSAFRFSEPAPTRRPALLRCRCDACGRRLPIHSHSVSCGDFHVYPSLARESVRTRYRARSSHRKHRPRDRSSCLNAFTFYVRRNPDVSIHVAFVCAREFFRVGFHYRCVRSLFCRHSLFSGHAHYRRSRRQRRAVASNRDTSTLATSRQRGSGYIRESSKRITEDFGVSFGATYTFLGPMDTVAAGFQNLDTTFKYRVLKDPA